MHLAESGVRAGDALGPLGHDPLGVLADELDVGLAEPGLLSQLAPGSLERPLPRLQAALGQLPLARNVGSLEHQQPPVLTSHGDHDAGAEVTAGHGRTLLMLLECDA